MPRFNLTFDDQSPVIAYEGSWTSNVTPYPDMISSPFANGTHMNTSSTGAYATIQFNGTAAYIFGSTDTGRGQYTVSVDGKDTQISGLSNSLQYKSLLFGTGDLDSGAHTLKISNTGGTVLDLDYVTVTVGDSHDDANVELIEFEEDAWSNISYSGIWAGNNAANYHKDPNSANITGAVRVTSYQGDSATISFFGQSIVVHGCIQYNHGDYTVSLDSGSLKTFNGYRANSTCQQALWYASGLSPGAHTVQLTNASPNMTLGLDYVTVGRWAQSASASDSGSSHTGKRKSNVGAIVGGVIGGVVLLALIGFLVFFLMRRRRRETSKRKRTNILIDKDDTHTQPHTPEHVPFIDPTGNQVAQPPQMPQPPQSPQMPMPQPLQSPHSGVNENNDAPPPAYSQLQPSRTQMSVPLTGKRAFGSACQ